MITALGQRRFYQDRPSLSTSDEGLIHAEAYLSTNPFQPPCPCQLRACSGAQAFGRHAGALDQGDFEDRKPWEVPALAPEAGFAK